MAAIMQTVGPISTWMTIRQNWKFLRNSSTASCTDFEDAADALQDMGLGQVFCISTNKSYKVFVKKRPEEIWEVLCANPDICDPEMYPKRYHQPPPKCVGVHLRSKLVAMKLVLQKQMM